MKVTLCQSTKDYMAITLICHHIKPSVQLQEKHNLKQLHLSFHF